MNDNKTSEKRRAVKLESTKLMIRRNLHHQYDDEYRSHTHSDSVH